MQSELFQKFLLEGATDTRWNRVYTVQEMLDFIDAATPEQINYLPSEGEHKGKSVLWLVAKDCEFGEDKQYMLFERLLGLSNEDAINARAKDYNPGYHELLAERSVLSLVAETSGKIYKQFKLIATLLEKGARIDTERETHLFEAVCSSYETAISMRTSFYNPDRLSLKERMNAITKMHQDYKFIVEHLSKLCLKYKIVPGFNDVDTIRMSRFFRLMVNDFINRVYEIVNDTQKSYADSLEQDDVNTLRELLQMFKTESGKVLLDYVNNKSLLSHELLSEPAKESAPVRKSKRLQYN